MNPSVSSEMTIVEQKPDDAACSACRRRRVSASSCVDPNSVTISALSPDNFMQTSSYAMKNVPLSQKSGSSYLLNLSKICGTAVPRRNVF